MRTAKATFLVAALMCVAINGSIAQTTVLQEGFEGSTYSFASSGNSSWSLNSSLAAHGNQSQHAVIVNPGDSAVLTSLSFSTAGMSQVSLRFNHICKLDFFDGGYLEVSPDNGTTWIRLTGSHYQGQGQFANFMNKFNGFSYINWEPMNPTTTPTNAWWQHEVFDISAIAANTALVRVRFILKDMDNNGAAGNFGWLIDDVQVKGGTSDLIPPKITMNSGNPLDSVPGTGPFTVSTTILDDNGIASAYLIYTIGSFTDSVLMTASGNNVFTGLIPSQLYQTNICYKVKATDSALYQNTSVLPTSGCISFYNYKAPIPVQAGTSTTNSFYAPIYNASATGTEKYSQHISIFTPGDLTIQGTIKAILWEKANTNGYSLNDGRLRIYLKHTTQNTVSTTAGTFANEMQGATLVFEDTTLNLLLTQGWQNFNFNKANFFYNGMSNLMILVDWYRPGNLSGNFVNWNYTNAAQKAITFYGTAPNPSTTGGSGHRPNTIFMIDQLYFPYDAALETIIQPSGNIVTAQPLPVLVRIRNAGQQTLTKATIDWTINGVAQPTYYWTGNLGTDMVSNNVTLGQFQFPNGSGNIKAWTSMPNDSLDQNPYNDTASASYFGCTQILSGIYTVGTPTSDIPTMADLMTSLYSCGIAGPCTFRIMPGTYYGPFKINDSIQGLSSVNTITFTSFTGDPTSVVIRHGSPSAAANYVFNIDRANYITIDKLSIITTSTTAGNCITLTNSAANNTISGCILEMAYGENFDVNGIIVAAGCNYNTITGNKITNGYRNIVATATNSNLIKRLRIENNHLTDGSRYATNISYNDSLEIIGNTVYSGYVAPTSSRYGIQVNNSTRNQIIGNKIHMHMAGYAYGIFYQSNADAQGSPSLIANNFSMMTGSSTQYGNHALNYNASSHTRIYHNSFMIATGNSNAGTINFEGSCSNVDMKNNVIANLAGGLAINHYASAGLLLSSSDYNNFYTTGATLAKWNTSTLVPVSGGIAAWTALTLRDSNSIMLNPMFYSNTNLHSYSPLMNNAGTPLAAVTVDIDGEPRSVTAPDIGADEYTVSAIDAGAISIVSPSATMTQGATTPVKVVIRNYGSSNLTAAQVQYSLNGAAAQSINWAGSLTTGQTDTVTFPVIAVPPLQYSITAYTVLTGDTLYFNDTVTSTFYGNPLIDARVEEITSPIGGCNPGNEVVSIVIKNVGLQNIATGLTAHYQLANTSTVISEPITQVINTNATLAFTFATPVNIQSPVDTIFILKAWVSHLLDPNPGNDTLVEYISVQGPLPAPVVSDTTISYGQTVTLNAVSNYPVEWYASASSTSKLFAGAAFTTPPLFDTTVYYVEANTNIPSGEFFAGQGTNVSGQYEWPNPLGKAFGGSKHQFLILASELVSQGYSAGPVSSVSFFSSAALGSISGFEMQIGTTTSSQASTAFFPGPFQSVYSGAVNVVAGWSEVLFSTPFSWDGMSNLVIQTLTSSGATLLNPPLLYDSTAVPTTIYFLGTGAATATTGTPTQKRMNIRIKTIGTPGCNSVRVPVTVTVPPLQKDALLQDFAEPLSGCNISTTPVTILVVNHGLDTIFGGIQARYRINNGPFTTPENINTTILPYDTLYYTFNTQASLPSGAVSQKYVLTAAITMPGDMYTINDTLVSDSITSVYTPAPINVMPVTIPYATSATLSPPSSDTLYWYNQLSGGTPFFTGSPFITGMLYDTTTYWVEARYTSPLNTYQAGTGTNYNTASTYPSPYGSTQFGAKHQFLIRASELSALGMQKGEIQSIGFNVAAPGTIQLQNYTVRIGHSTQNTMGSFETNLITVFAMPTYAVTSGINTHQCQIPFTWDGISNLVIETCFKNSANGSIAQVYNTSTSFTSTLVAIGGATFNCNTTSGSGSFSTRPNIYLKVISYGECTSERVPVQVNLSGIPAVDAAIAQITSPQIQASSLTPTPVSVILKNYGTSPLTSAPIYYQVNNQPPMVYNWSGNLARLATQTVTLGNVTFSGGIENLKVWVAKSGDNYPANDTIAETLSVCMQGNYSVGIGKRFSTISEAVLALKQSGVCGHTFIDIDPGNYAEQLLITGIAGTGPSSTVTFRSSTLDSTDVTITSMTNASNTYVISVLNGSYILLKHLTITANGSTHGYSVSIDGNSSNITVANNILNGASATSQGNSAGIFSNSIFISNITISHNVINSGYNGVHFAGSTAGNQNKLLITRNMIYDFTQVGIYAYYQDSLEISHNTVISGTSSQYYYGARAYYLANGFAIHGNKMMIYPTNYGYGIDINYTNGTAANFGLVYNNMISLLTGTGAHQGLSSVSNTYIKYLYNSVLIAGPSTSGRAMHVGSGSNIHILNNNFTVEGIGYVFYTTVPGTIAVMNHNNYYVTPTSYTFVHWGGAISSFAAFQAFDPTKNAQSVNVDPFYSSQSNLHAGNVLINGKATPIAGITTDFDGQLRNTTNPDIGADEFFPALYDLAALKMVKPFETSCGYTASDSIKVRLRNAGENDFNFALNPATVKVYFSGVVTDTISTVVNTGILASGNTVDITVHPGYNLGNKGQYMVYASVLAAIDTVLSNNESIPIAFVSLTPINVFPYTETFESGSDLTFKQWYGMEAKLSVSGLAANNSVKGLHFEGGGYSFWTTPTTTTQAFNNTEHLAQALTCEINPAGVNSLRMKFDLKQTYTSIGNPNTSWFRVMLHNIHGSHYLQNTSGDTVFQAITTNADPFVTQIFDLQQYLGQPFNISLESVCRNRYGEGTYSGDNAFVDNFIIWEPLQHDVSVDGFLTPKVNFNKTGNLQNVEVTVTNLGTQTITSLPLNYQVGNGNIATEVFSVNIPPFSSHNLTFTVPFITQPGINSLCVFATLPGDGDQNNDTTCMLFRGLNTFSVPYSDDFEGAQEWVSLGTNQQWELGTPAMSLINTANSGVNAWGIRLGQDYLPSSVEILYSPYFIIPPVADTATLSFSQWMDVVPDKAYGILQYTTNMGTSWNNLGYIGSPDGTNWYNAIVTGLHCWSNSQTGWSQSSHILYPSVFNTGMPVQFRFTFYSANYQILKNGWAIDDFMITIPPPANDAATIAITSPISSTPAGETIPVIVKVKNMGTDPITTLPISFKIGNSAPVTENWNGTLLSGDTLTYTFNATYIAPVANYALCAYSKLSGDLFTLNDTLCSSITATPGKRDAGITKVITPTGQVGTNSTVEVRVEITNFGTDTLFSIPLEYKVGSVFIGTDNYSGTLLPGATTSFTFASTYLSPTGNYSVCAKTLLSGDVNPGNDETCEPIVATGIGELYHDGFRIGQNIPNPASDFTLIPVMVPLSGKVFFNLYDLTGTLIQKEEYPVTAGNNELRVHTGHIAAGTYIYRIEFNGMRKTMKMMILK